MEGNMKQCNLRIWTTTRQALKILAARLGKPMVQVLDDLVHEAIAKLDAKESQT
jgi:hypothetical protein